MFTGTFEEQSNCIWLSHLDGTNLQVAYLDNQGSTAQSNMLPMQFIIGLPVMMIENQKAKMRYLAKNQDAPFKEGVELSAINFTQ